MTISGRCRARERLNTVKRRLHQECQAEVRAIRSVEWRRLNVVENFRWGTTVLVAFVAVGLAVIFLSMPQALAANENGPLIGRFVFAQLLVQLLWMICAWFSVALIAPLVGTVLEGRPLLAGLEHVLRSVPNISTWTGRITMPVVLASLAAGVAQFPTDAGGGRSLLVTIGGVQLGMLFVALLIVLSFEAVRVVPAALIVLPRSLRGLAAVLLPFAAWALASRLWPQYPITGSLLASLAPQQFDEVDRSTWVHTLTSQVFYVPAWGGFLYFAAVWAFQLAVPWVLYRGREH